MIHVNFDVNVYPIMVVLVAIFVGRMTVLLGRFIFNKIYPNNHLFHKGKQLQ